MSDISVLKRPFFVYGTLLPNQPNHYLFAKSIASIQPATINNCQMYDMGAYPMLVAQVGAIAQGMLITVFEEDALKVRQRLDSLEGYDPNNHEASAYKRVPHDIVLENGRIQSAWVYLGTKSIVKNMPAIEHSDWIKHISNKRKEIYTWWETIETVAGLHQVEE